MVRTGGPRGHGSGRAATPEAEAARRAKISASRRASKDRVRVRISSEYRSVGRTYGPSGRRLDDREDWNYRDREYSTRIDPRIANNPNKLAAHLNRLHPNRVHYRTRVVEYV